MSAVSKDSLNTRTHSIVLLDVLTLWHTSMPTNEVAKKLKVAPSTLQDFAKKNKLPVRKHIPRQRKTQMVDPTPEEIAERAAECRARRTETENERLTYYKQRPVEIRQYAYSSRTGIFSDIG